MAPPCNSRNLQVALSIMDAHHKFALSRRKRTTGRKSKKGSRAARLAVWNFLRLGFSSLPVKKLEMTCAGQFVHLM